MLYSFLTFLPFTVCLYWTAVFVLEWRKANPAQHLLTLFMAVCAVLYWCHAMFFNSVGGPARTLADCVYVFCNLAAFPLYLIYIYRLTGAGNIARRAILWLAPATAIAAINCIASNYPPPSGFQSAVTAVAKATFLVQLAPICYVATRRLRRFDREVDNYFSNTEERSVTMTRHIMLVLCGCACISAVASLLGRERFFSSEWRLIIPSVLFGATLFAVGFVGHKQALCADDIAPDTTESSTPGLSRALQELQALMATDHLYLQSDLRLSEVAARIGIGRSALSACINQEAGMSFSDYVNGYRVAHAQQIMSDEAQRAQLSVIQIAEQSGFASESSFYRAFRKVTGMTPKQWLTRH